MSNGIKIKGLGAIPHAGGVAFRVWAPHAQRVAVIGSFNGWDGDKHPLQAEESGTWYTDVAPARVGDQYKFLLTTAQGELKRIDPYAREVTNSIGNAIVHDPGFDWEGDDFHLAPWNEVVIYELHVGTFNEKDDNMPGQFATVSARLGHLEKLGVNAIQIMPIGEFTGERSWGYNPSTVGTRADRRTTSWSSPTSSASRKTATSSASRPQGHGGSVSTATGKAITTTSKGIRAPMWCPKRVPMTAFPSTPRFLLAPTAC